MELLVHPTQDSCGIRVAVAVSVRDLSAQATVELDVIVDDPRAVIEWPLHRAGQFQEQLWQSTCVELFMAGEDGAYYESHYAASGDYAHYQLAFTRAPLQRQRWPIPSIALKPGPTQTTWRIQQTLPVAWPSAHGQVVVVLKCKDQSCLHWARQHPPAKPDFHDDRYWSALW